jgi:hypothetical protein
MFESHLRLGAVLVGAAALALVTGSGGCGSSNTRFGGYMDGGQPHYDGSADVVTTIGDDSGQSITGDSGGIIIGDGSGPGGPVQSLKFDPPSATVTVTEMNAPLAINFKLIASNPPLPDKDVAPQQAVFTRSDIAAMTPNNPVVLTASGQAAGDGVLQAVYGGRVAIATLHVSVHLTSTGMGVDPGAPGAIDGATAPDPSVTSLLYPYDQTVFPQGLVSPLMMWNAPNAGDVYRIRYEEKDFICDDYQVVTPPAQMRLSQKCWDAMTSSNQGDPISVTLSRWDAATKKAYVSAKQSWPLALANMQGAVYYWTTTGPTDAYLASIQPGLGAKPKPLYSAATGGTPCLACHGVSADGKTLVAVAGDVGKPSPAFPGENTMGGPASGYCAISTNTCDETPLANDARAWISFDIANGDIKPRYQSNMFGGNVAVSPDGTDTVFGDVTLFLADTKTGNVYLSSGLDNVALDTGNLGLMMPAFSPDGKHLVAVEGGTDTASGSTSYITLTGASAKLLQLDYDGVNHKFSNPKGFATEGTFTNTMEKAFAYPTYSPDSSLIVFHAGDRPAACGMQCDANETSTGAIYAQYTSGGTPIRLTTMTDTPGIPATQQRHAFEPTFNPLARGGYFWVVFSAERDWGNRIMVGGSPTNANKRLWVAAIDATSGKPDPSHPPFFIEGQDENRLNMRGFWANAACIPTQGGGTCQNGFECCSGYCDQGMCFTPGGNVCVPIGMACKMTSDCCDSPFVQCVNGICGTTNN